LTHAWETTSSAALVFVDAPQRARAEGTNQIREEHLFAALLSNPDSRPLLGQLGGPDEAEAVWAGRATGAG
jgi:Clp amino terminal domain, pathogenicity island component